MADLTAQAIEQAERVCIGAYEHISKHTVEKNWAFPDEDIAKIKYDENGYIIVQSVGSVVTEHEVLTQGSDQWEQWTIDVTLNVGFDLETESFIVSQAANGDWIVDRT